MILPAFAGSWSFDRNFHMFKRSAERSFMRKNKIGKVYVCLLAFTMSLQALFCCRVMAEETFVSEEEAVIGGEENETAEPVQPQPQALPGEAVSVQEKPETGTDKVTSLQEKQEEKQEVPKEEEEKQGLSGNSVSKNGVPRLFKVPEEKTIEKKMSEEYEYEEEAYEETEEPAVPEEHEKRENAVCLLIAGGICMAAGVARIICRLLIRYGKL